MIIWRESPILSGRIKSEQKPLWAHRKQILDTLNKGRSLGESKIREHISDSKHYHLKNITSVADLSMLELIGFIILSPIFIQLYTKQGGWYYYSLVIVPPY